MRNLLFSFAFLFSFCLNAQQQLVFTTSLLPVNDTVHVFTPKDYGQGEKYYPVVFLLHGYSGDYSSWNKVTDVQALADEFEMIVVCPDGLFSCWYVNSPVIKELKFKTFFFSILIKAINEQYRMDRSNIFITGLSMGGHGALYFFSERPGLFRAAGSTSGMVDLTEKPDEFDLDKIFGRGATGLENLSKYSAITNIDKLAGSKKPLFVDCGSSDMFYLQTLRFYAECKKKKAKINLKIMAGGHSREYWKKSIPLHFGFFREKLNN